MGITHHLSFAALAPRRRGGLIATAAAIFALGFAAGATIRPAPTPHGGASITTALAAAHDASERTPTAATHSRTFDRQLAYPADVIRIIDGDTFEARARLPGLNVDTKVRLRNVDAPELHARCADELAKAQAARAALETMLAAGGVTISQVGIDKYGGRVDAVVSTRDTADLSAALLNGAGREATTADGVKAGADSRDQ
jgi:endonuclease YncB( thermonuclease family)